MQLFRVNSSIASNIAALALEPTYMYMYIIIVIEVVLKVKHTS